MSSSDPRAVGFWRGRGAAPERPPAPRRFTFEDEWFHRAPFVGKLVVPIECVEPGDEQVAVFDELGRPYWEVALTSLDGLPDTVRSVVGLGEVRASRPLPHVRELFANTADEATLRNLPALERLSLGSGPDQLPVDAQAVPEGIVDLGCGRETFESLSVLTRFAGLERLSVMGVYRESAEPLAALTGLRWLRTDAKALQHLARLERLERVELDLEGGSLANLKRFGGWTGLRHLAVTGRKLKSLEGVQAFEGLETLRLREPGIPTLDPVRALGALREVELVAPGDLDLSPLADLPALRRLSLHMSGRPAPDLSALAHVDVELRGVDGTAGTGPSVGRVRYRRLDDGRWSIFQDLSAEFGAGNNYEVEERLAAVLAPLGDRLLIESETGRLSVLAREEQDIRTAAALIDLEADRARA